MVQRFGVLHIVFLAAVGLSGWVAVTAVTAWPPAVLRPWHLSGELLAVLVLCTGARFLAFKVFRRVRVALDSVFYVASAFAFGIVPAAWMMLLVLSFDGLVRQASGLGSTQKGESPWRYDLAIVVYSGGMPALMCLAVGVLFNVDGFYPRDDVTLAWLLPTFAIAFLVLHYTFAGGSHWFEGAPPKDLWRRISVRVVPAELIMIPIALAMVYGHLHQGFLPYMLLGASALTFNLVFRRARVARDKLDARVHELATLVKVGQAIAGSLERRALLSNISTETLKLVGHGSRFMVGQIDAKRGEVRYELFDEDGERYRELTAPVGAGLSGWVMSQRKPLLLRDARKEYRGYAGADDPDEPSFHSWLGVPLVIYDEVVGVLAVQSGARRAYHPDHVRVLSGIADQASVALENSRLYELATVDGLTGLLVRRHFDQRLQEEWDRAVRYRTEFTLGLLDLDNFKEVNDRHGHQVGDRVLRAAADRVRQNMRAADLAGRYGGEEFAFLLQRTSVAEGCKVAERIRADVETLAVEVDDAPVKIKASIGVAGYPESGVCDVDDLIARADEALYQAKGEGKNRVVAAPAAPTDPASRSE